MEFLGLSFFKGQRMQCFVPYLWGHFFVYVNARGENVVVNQQGRRGKGGNFITIFY